MRLAEIIPADDFYPLWLEGPDFLPTVKPQFVPRPEPVLVVAWQVRVEPWGDRHHVWQAIQRHVICCIRVGVHAPIAPSP